jgi:hypothetical protein
MVFKTGFLQIRSRLPAQRAAGLVPALSGTLTRVGYLLTSYAKRAVPAQMLRAKGINRVKGLCRAFAM